MHIITGEDRILSLRASPVVSNSREALLVELSRLRKRRKKIPNRARGRNPAKACDAPSAERPVTARELTDLNGRSITW